MSGETRSLNVNRQVATNDQMANGLSLSPSGCFPTREIEYRSACPAAVSDSQLHVNSVPVFLELPDPVLTAPSLRTPSETRPNPMERPARPIGLVELATSQF